MIGNERGKTWARLFSSLPLCNTPCQRQVRSGGMRAGRQDFFWAQNLSITKPHLSSSATIFFSWHLGRGPAGHSHHQKDEAHTFFPPYLTLGSWDIRPSRGRTQNKSQFPANRGVLTPPTALPKTALPHIRTRRTFSENNLEPKTHSHNDDASPLTPHPHSHPYSFAATAPGSQGCTPRARMEWWVCGG